MSKCSPTRRDLLLGGCAALAGAGAGVFGGVGPLRRLALGGESTPRYYIFCYFSGGWDSLLSLDPRDPNVYSDEQLAERLIQTGYAQLDGGQGRWPSQTDAGFLAGPYMGDLAGLHSDKLCIVRGMSMETLVHEGGRRRFITGKAPSGLQARGSSGATWLASLLGEADPVPSLSVGVESFNDGLPSYASALKVNSVADLMRTLEAGSSSVRPFEEDALAQLLGQEADCPAALQSALWQEGEVSRIRSREMLSEELYQHFDFLADTPEMADLRDFYGILDPSGPLSWQLTQPEGLPPQAAATAVHAITKGVSRVVSIQLARSLDHHFSSWATEHGPNQEAGFDLVARMIEALDSTIHEETGQSYLSHTTIVGFSEFTRTAMLNMNGGRDHSLTGACFLAGGNIVGGRALGASSEVGMEPTVMDLSTGESLESSDLEEGVAEVVKPEHILRALLQDAGTVEDEADLRVPPLTALFG